MPSNLNGTWSIAQQASPGRTGSVGVSVNWRRLRAGSGEARVVPATRCRLYMLAIVLLLAFWVYRHRDAISMHTMKLQVDLLAPRVRAALKQQSKRHSVLEQYLQEVHRLTSASFYLWDSAQQGASRPLNESSSSRAPSRLTAEEAVKLNAVEQLNLAAVLAGDEEYVKVIGGVFPHQTLRPDHGIARTTMLNATKSIYCQHPALFLPDLVPAGGCGRGSSDPDQTRPVITKPWCNAMNASLLLFNVSDGIVENFGVEASVAMNVITGKGAVITAFNTWSVDTFTDVFDFPSLAVLAGAADPYSPGHFSNEVLPSLIMLDILLPIDIPILWPMKGTGEDYFVELQSYGMLSARQFVPLTEKSIYRANQLYALAPGDGLNGRLSFGSWIAQRITALHFSHMLVARYLVQYGPTHVEAIRHQRLYKAVILDRPAGRARSFVDPTLLRKTVQDTLGPSFEVDSVIAGREHGSPMSKVAEAVFGSCLIIGAHGANMHNMIFLEPGSPCWVVEIGYQDLSLLPTDWYCFARNLGYKHFMTFATSGGYQTPLRPNLQELQQILEAYKQHVAVQVNSKQTGRAAP